MRSSFLGGAVRPVDIGRRDRDDALIAEVLERADPAQVKRIMAWDHCELDGDFLGFLNVYAGASLIVPAGVPVVDFGCYVGLQSVLLPQARPYIGVDVTDGPRYEGPNVEHFVGTIRKWIAQNPDVVHDPSAVAICSYVPDRGSCNLIRRTFDNVISYYPASSRRDAFRPPARDRSSGGLDAGPDHTPDAGARVVESPMGASGLPPETAAHYREGRAVNPPSGPAGVHCSAPRPGTPPSAGRCGLRFTPIPTPQEG